MHLIIMNKIFEHWTKNRHIYTECGPCEKIIMTCKHTERVGGIHSLTNLYTHRSESWINYTNIQGVNFWQNNGQDNRAKSATVMWTADFALLSWPLFLPNSHFFMYYVHIAVADFILLSSWLSVSWEANTFWCSVKYCIYVHCQFLFCRITIYGHIS